MKRLILRRSLQEPVSRDRRGFLAPHCAAQVAEHLGYSCVRQRRMSPRLERAAYPFSYFCRGFLKLIILLSVTIFLAAPLQAERKPGHLFPPEKIDILEEPREWQKPEEVLEFLEIREGDVVADIGAGAGYFALLFAPKVGAKGLVYAEEIQKEMVDYMKKKINSLGIQNVKVVLGEPTNPRLPEGSLDLAFLGSVYHEVEKPIELLKNISRELKPEGRLAIIDWDPYRKSPIGPPREERVPEDVVIKEAEEAGFHFFQRHDFLPYHYFIIFRKR